MSEVRSIFVTDFDGTLTRHDFYRLVVDRLLPADFPDQWQDYRSGSITHFEALSRYFKAIRRPVTELMSVLDEMQIEPNLPSHLNRLQSAGWRVIVASAGCDWYIRELFRRQAVELEVHANPGFYDPESGLVMELPVGSPYYSPQTGINKAEIIRQALQSAEQVAFAGDGFPDAEAARLVDPRRRFARSDLAQVLDQEGLTYQSFEAWSEIVDHLLLNRG